MRHLLRNVEPEAWAQAWAGLEDKAVAQLRADGFADDEMTIRRFAAMRYKGQTFEISIPIPAGPLTRERIRSIEEAFGDEHERTYGHRASFDEPVQLISIQVAGLAARRDTQKPGKPQRHQGDLQVEQPPRKAYFGRGHGWLETAIIPRAALSEPRRGPCIVEEYDTTCVVPPGATARLDAMSNIIITLD